MKDGDPGVVPMLTYADGVGALEWLADVFGFEEQMRMMDGDHLSQGVMDTEFGRIMLASGPPDYEGPRRHAEECVVARTWMSVPWIVDGVLVYVKDPVAHYQHAKDRGARILPRYNPRTHRRRRGQPEFLLASLTRKARSKRSSRRWEGAVGGGSMRRRVAFALI
ncbi:MAG TPA: hypothetical protein VIX84_14525 [Acidimicrobiales bacterium]